MVIIEVRNNDGVLGRCDANCYNATGPNCYCVCGGINHGVGLKIACEDRNYILDEYILENLPAQPDEAAIYIIRTPIQMELFK